MGTSLFNKTPAETYPGLMKMGNNAPLGTTLRPLSDGEGNDMPMQVSEDTINFTANVTQDGTALENTVNKSVNVGADKLSNVKYPSVKAVFDWASGLFATITALTSGLAIKTDKRISINRKTASYTLVVTDVDKLIETNISGANHIGVPANVFTNGDQILVAQYGTGQTTILANSGMTIRSNGGKVKLAGQYSGGTLLFISPTECYLFGDIAS